MKWIKEYFIKGALAKNNTGSLQKETLNLNQIQTICIIAGSRSELEDVQDVVSGVLGASLNVQGIFFDERSTDEQAFSHKDFSLFAKPQQKLSNFLSLNPDLIIFTSEKLNFFSLYLLHLEMKPYAIGFYSEPLKPYLDLMLNREGEDIKSATEQLIKYLKQIN